MHSLLVIKSAMHAPERTSSTLQLPERLLKSNGYIVTHTHLKAQAEKLIIGADAVVFHLPVSAIKLWAVYLAKYKPTPILWWCDESAAAQSLEDCEDDIVIDGLLTPSMNGHEIHWALHFCAKHFYDRLEWQNEREQLLSRLEDRKWIDTAKGILSETKGITEPEAYDLLRKQAMNERKRLVDVATSLVKAYELMHKSNGKGDKTK
ncbi:ANTAR domain-containing response regulator [Paenibacillus thermotolerans]|uniref:ANTAR domain-containing response regulator n=1 Tax=Paenibacillus thermotolerans TaxID=3027807 RepID=UPI002368C271|nr:MULTISPECIES: ANTAR domain-containing protein [unclassified Paenibacillus]